MIIYVLANDEQRTVSSEHENREGVQTINFSSSDTIPDLANNIKSRVEAERTTISLLRMASHGNAGGHMFYRRLTIGSAPQFKVLHNKFAPGGRGIELWGCNVAAASLHQASDYRSPEGQAQIIRHLELMRDPSTHLRGPQTPSEFQRDQPTPSRLGVGYGFMKVLAYATNTTVTAGYDTQHRDTSEFADRRVRWKWDGRGLLKVFPDGRYQMIPLINNKG